jgi:hypothetical protein
MGTQSHWPTGRNEARPLTARTSADWTRSNADAAFHPGSTSMSCPVSSVSIPLSSATHSTVHVSDLDLMDNCKSHSSPAGLIAATFTPAEGR